MYPQLLWNGALLLISATIREPSGFMSEGLSSTVACNKAEDLICPNDFDPEIVSLGRISYWLDLIEFISWKLRSSRVDRQDIVS